MGKPMKARVAAWLLAALLPCGCSSMARDRQAEDPLLGGFRRASGPGEVAVAAPAPAEASGRTASAAAPGSGPLALREQVGGSPAGVQPAWQPPAQPVVQPASQPRPPEPVFQPVSRASASPVPASRSTYEQIQAQLTARGVKWQRQETWGDTGWKFSCSVPNKQNPFISRTYEAQAPTYLAAVQAVLEQIDREASGVPAEIGR